MDVSVVGTYKSFIRQRVRRMKPGHLGNLGGLGVAVLEIQELHALLPGIGEKVRKSNESALLILEKLKILWVTRGTAVHVW
jgi:hypothetical protein